MREEMIRNPKGTYQKNSEEEADMENSNVGIFRALSDPTRTRIIDLILKKKMSVLDIARTLRLDQPLVSYHLRHLKNYGLVEVERNKKSNLYTISPAKRDLVDLMLRLSSVRDKRDLIESLLSRFKEELAVYVGDDLAERYLENIKKEIMRQ